MKKLTIVAALLLGLSACNTIEGFGRDVSAGARALARPSPGSLAPAMPRISPISRAMRAAKAPPELVAASMAIKNWPVRGGPPAVPEKGLASMPKLAPAMAAAMVSTKSARPTPL